MYVKINRNVCSAQLAFCERCLGQFLKNPMGYERRCFEVIEDDGKDELTLEIFSEQNHVVVTLNEEQRKQVAGEGWSYFVDFQVPMYRNTEREKPHEITEEPAIKHG